MKRSTLYLWSFLLLGWLVQILAYSLQPDQPLSLISGLLGICSVVLCSQGNIWTFFFGFGQILTYSWLCYEQRLYAELGINAFYFGSQIYGIYVWARRMKGENSSSRSLTTRSLGWTKMGLLTLLLIALSTLLGWCLAYWTDDSQPYLDAYTTVPALAAQILMVLAYKENWLIWFAIDILYIVLWARAGDYCMLMQYSFWCINTIYGYWMWRRSDEAL